MHDVVEVWVILKTEPDTRINMQVVYGGKGGDSRNLK